MTRRMAFVLLLPLLMAACGDSPTAPDDTSMVAATVSPTVFEGTLDLNESRFYSFTVSQSGSVTAYVASLTLVGHRDALVVPVRLGVGVPRGEGCAITASVETSPALVTQLTTTLSAGIYCVNISDIGSLPGAAVFSIRFRHS
jgi:hypothetical protein